MKTLIISGFILLAFTGSIMAQKVVSGKSKPTHVVLKPEYKRGMPPNLYVDLTYEDGNKNGILEPNEVSVLKLKITNKGKGPAQGLLIKVSDNVYDPEFHILDGQKIPYLYPGQTTEVNVPIKAGFDIKSKEHKLKISVSEHFGYDMAVLKAVEDVNQRQKSVLYAKAKKYFGGSLKGKTFGIWGLAFKPQTDDMREAPSLVIIEKLLAEGAKVKAYDPVAMEEARRILGDKIEFCNDKYETLVDADGLIVVTEWPEFRVLNYSILEKLMLEKVIFDGRNIYDAEELREHGFSYYSIGRQAVKP